MTVKYPIQKSDIPKFKEQAYILRDVFMDIYQTKISNFAILDAYANALGYVNASTLSIEAALSRNNKPSSRFLPVLDDKTIIEKTMDALQLDHGFVQRVVSHPVFMKFLRKQAREIIDNHLERYNTLESDNYKEVNKHCIDTEDSLLYEEEGDKNSLLTLNGYRYYHLDRAYSSRSFVVENLVLGFRCITPKSVDTFTETEDGRYVAADSDCRSITMDWLSESEAQVFSKHFKVMITPQEYASIKGIDLSQS